MTLKLSNDDEIFRVNNFFLGPPGTTYWPRARYSAYIVFPFVLVFYLIIMRKLGIGLSAIVWCYLVFVTVATTMWILRWVNTDVPVLGLCSTFWHEVDAPRTPKAIHLRTTIPARCR